MKKHHIYSLISSIISLVVTCGLLIVCLFAWYTNNKNVSASGIVGSTADSNYSFCLEMYQNDEYSEITEKIKLGNLNPGDVFYFRIKVSNKSKDPKADLNFNIKFSNVGSKLIDKLVVNDDYVSYNVSDKKKVNLYEIKDNKVITDSKENNVLYSINGDSSISLGDYKIEDVFMVYPGVKSSDSFTTDKNKLGLTSTEINVKTIGDNESYYCYFALEFNSEASLVTIDGIESSNAYMFQELIIKSIDIREVK